MRQLILCTVLLPVMLFSCSENKGSKFSKEQLQGDWVEVRKENYMNGPGFSGDFGLGFQGDTIEFKLGFWPDNKGGSIGNGYHFTQYDLRNDSVFFINLDSKEWEFNWIIKSIINDTLTLNYDDSTFLQLSKMKYENQIFTDFDQIIFSTQGCYGAFEAYSISLKSDGSVLYHGNSYVENIGFFKTQVDSFFTKEIFKKYYNGNIINLEIKQSVSSSHSQDLHTSFIKDGKIVKSMRTVNSYGGIGQNELLWANLPMEILQRTQQFDSILNNKHTYGIVGHHTFYNDLTYVSLENSECFYLWSELNHAAIVDPVFNGDYTLRVYDNFYYTGFNHEAEDFDYHTSITEVKTDGRYYQFNFKSKKPIVYDLGYNFIEVNFSANDFEKIED